LCEEEEEVELEKSIDFNGKQILRFVLQIACIVSYKNQSQI
jgi:hypothetical protein